MRIRFTIIVALLFLLETFAGTFFPGMYFINGGLTITNRIITYLLFFTLLYLLVLLFKPNRSVKIFFAGLFGFFFFIIALSEIHPIDTTTEPVDIAIIRKDPDGRKLVVREYVSEKTNAGYTDTVLVRDIFIFRRIYTK